MDTLLKLSPVWHFFSQAGCCAGSQSFTLRVGHYLSMHFFLKIPFLLHKHNLSALSLFVIAKGLAMCRLGGVISTQIVLF